MLDAPVLLVSGEYPPDVGGLADYTACLRRALIDRGLRVDVLTRARAEPPERGVARVVKRWDARSLIELLRRAPRAGIVHIQFQAAAFDLLGDICLVPVLLRAQAPVNVVTTFHGARLPYLFPKAGSLRQVALRVMARTSHAVLASDERDLRLLRAPRARSHVVPIGSNVPADPPPGYRRDAFRASLGLGPGDLAVVYFGLLNASKGLPTLLAAWQRIVEAEPTARLLLLGGPVGASDPTDRQTADRVTRDLACFGAGVVRTGYLAPRDLSAYLLAADVALLPYADGASPRRGSLLACAAHGLPIVSTAPAAADLDQVVLAAPAGDADALASAVLRVGRDAVVREHFRRGSARVAERTAWARIAEQHLGIYTSLSVR